MAAQQFWQAIEEFNQQQFYACHDTLEALWIDAVEPHKSFYQGILQIAVGCYHLGNHNWRGAVILLGEGTKRLQSYQPIYQNIDVSSLFSQSLDLLAALQNLDPEKIVEFATKLEANSRLENSGESLFHFPKINQVDS